MAESVLVLKVEADGSIKSDARKVSGDEAEILELLEALAVESAGDRAALKVEKHEAGVKHSHGVRGHVHSHN